MISKLRLFVLLFAIGIVPLCAQNNEITGKYFRTLGAGVTASDLHYSVRNHDRDLSVIDSVRSIFYLLNGTPKLVFYRIATGPDGKPVHIPAAQADLTHAGMLTLLVFTSDAPGSNTYNVQVFPDDLTAFPLGSYRIINRSQLPVKVMFGNQSTDLAPKDVRTVAYQSNGAGAVAARVYTCANNTPRLVYADTWRFSMDSRVDLVIASAPERPGLISVSRLRDNPTSLLRKEYLPKE